MKTIKPTRKFSQSKKIRAHSNRIRLCVFRSNKHNYVSLINDVEGKTIVGIDDQKMKGKDKTEIAFNLGMEIGKIANEKKIKSLVFDRRGHKFHGIVKAIADGAKKAGINI